MKIIEKHKKIILFDGDCNLCNSSIQFVVKRDKMDVFRFTSLQSQLGKQILKDLEIDPSVIDSIVLVEYPIAYVRSQAALKIAYELGKGWFLLKIFECILPLYVKDYLYNFIAKNRYKWFGNRNQCMIPTPELRAKFLK